MSYAVDSGALHPAEPPVDGRPSAHAGLRPIVIADDDPTSVLLIEAALDALHLVNPRLCSPDGEAVVALLATCATGRGPCPALVLLDMQMPGRSGLEVLAWMRSDPVLMAVPVVLLTGDGSIASIREAYAGGVTSYLVKPVGFDALADVLRGLDAPWALA